ncbi:hypothetical protein, partial [Flavobacterium aurantiibacter]
RKHRSSQIISECRTVEENIERVKPTKKCISLQLAAFDLPPPPSSGTSFYSAQKTPKLTDYFGM